MDKNDQLKTAHELLESGSKLTPEEVLDLELKIEDVSDALDSRMKLLGYYCGHKCRSRDCRAARIKHIAWMVMNNPGHPISGPECSVDRGIDRWRDFGHVSSLWRKQARLYWNDPNIVANAADFFLLNQIELAEKYFLRAKELEPNNEHWASRLSQVYEFWGLTYEHLALAEGERSLSLCNDLFRELSARIRLPKLAYEAGDYDKAAAYAAELLQLVERSSQEKIVQFLYPTAIQAVHMTLGRIALREGDVKTASERLLKTLPEKRDPMAWLEPDRHLVAELFVAGDREAVLKWIDRCKLFLQIPDWKETVESGQSPWDASLPEYRRYFCLSRLPRSAFNSGDYNKAQWAANEFIALAKWYAREAKNGRLGTRHTGFGLHTAHVVLGQLALRNGDVGAAQKRLARAGQVPEADRLQEQGPDISLAAELTRAGELGAVRKFLSDCQRLWGDSEDGELLKEWDSDVMEGKVPEDWQWLLSEAVNGE